MSGFRLNGSGGYGYGTRRRAILGDPDPEETMDNGQGGGALRGPLFECHCKRSDSGKVIEKIENGPQGRNHFSYAYDQAGHLTEVRKNEELSEYYFYDDCGRRIQDFRSWAAERRTLTYYYTGALIQAGKERLEWTDKGQLAAIIHEDGRRDAFYHGHDSRLDRALLAQRTDIRYYYEKSLMPVKITLNGALAAECQWRDKLRLLRYKDYVNGLLYEFHYGQSRVPVQVTLGGTQDAVYRASGIYAQRLTLKIRADQVDSIRALSLPDGKTVKYIEYDSFGNVTVDNRPQWKFPLGFACGLNDPWTGLVRFGYRDYDPRFGRFTARDPIGDTGGDHDLWDYCVDDPVSMNDPSGLIAPLLLFGLGQLGAGALGIGLSYAAAGISDFLNRKDDSKKQSAVEAMNTVTPYVGATMAAGATPGALVLGGPGAARGVTYASQRMGAAMQASPHGAKIMKGITHTAQFAEPFLVPGPPVAASVPGTAGAVINWGVNQYKESKK